MAAHAFIIRDVRVFDGESTIEIGFVFVSNGKIKSAGSISELTVVPLGVEIISKPDHTVLPGFIDAHTHCDKGNEEALYQALRFGVTTMMDLHNEIHNCRKLKTIAKDEVDLAADFKCAGLAATIENGWPKAIVTAYDSSPEVVKQFTICFVIYLNRS